MAGDFLNKVKSRDTQLWTILDETFSEEKGDNPVKAIIGTRIEETGHGIKKANILFCTGKGAKEWKGLIDVIKQWAIENGCTRLKGLMRKGWIAVFPEFRVNHVQAEMRLDDGWQ